MDTVQVSYGDYLFTPNPASIAVADRRDPAVTTLPGGGWLLEPVRLPRQAALEGSLFAEDAAAALSRFEALRQRYEAGGTALLCLPGYLPFPARFIRLELTAEGDGRVLAYRAEFIEEGTSQ